MVTTAVPRVLEAPGAPTWQSAAGHAAHQVPEGRNGAGSLPFASAAWPSPPSVNRASAKTLSGLAERRSNSLPSMQPHCQPIVMAGAHLDLRIGPHLRLGSTGRG